jgi:predicted transcriptional regulator
VRRGIRQREAAACIAAALKKVRQHAGISQERLALNAWVARTYVGRIERNVLNPTMVSMDTLLTALDMSWTQFGVELDLAKRLCNDRARRSPSRH